MHERHETSLDSKAAAKATEKQLTRYSSQALRTAADSLYENAAMKDKACAIYKMIAVRYKDVPEDAESAAHANLKLWNRYMFDFHDVSSAMEYLNAAADICQTEGLTTAESDYAYAVSYQNMGNHTREPELYRKSLDYYEGALDKISKTGETEIYDRLIPNYLTLLYSMNEPMSRGSHHMEAYERTARKKTSLRQHDYSVDLYNGLTALQSRRFPEAAAYFSDMRQNLDTTARKQIYMSLLNEATALQQSGRVRDALKVLDKADSLSSTDEDNEMLVSLYYTKSKYWEQLGDTVNSRHFYYLYCQLRDSLLSYRQITGLRKAEFSQSMTQLGHKLSELEYKGNLKTVAIVASAIIMLLLLGAALVVRNRNRVLKQSNRALYEQNKAVLEAEKREREERLRYALMLESIRRDTAGDFVPQTKPEKYSSRRLTGDIKNEIHDAVLDAMENCQELYSSDFSLGRLSEICGSRQEYVSQVINETFGCNFNELVNRYRIREACRRIEDKENYGQFTLAAIASGVGIDSPTTFSKYFKRVTGLTPSQYKKNSDAVYEGS